MIRSTMGALLVARPLDRSEGRPPAAGGSAAAGGGASAVGLGMAEPGSIALKGGRIVPTWKGDDADSNRGSTGSPLQTGPEVVRGRHQGQNPSAAA